MSSTDLTSSEPDDAVLRCQDVRVVFSGGRRLRAKPPVRAVDGVSFDLRPGRTLAVVGESGCGKSSLARALAGVQSFTGRINVEDQDVDPRGNSARPRREAGGEADGAPRAGTPGFGPRVQMVFQDPYASLNPRRTVAFSVAEPMRAQGLRRTEIDARVAELFGLVGLDPDMTMRYPHEFSGGQRQRLAIARSLGADPGVLVCDEATSALDVSVQAQIVNLLVDAQRVQGFAMVFVTHNLAVARQVADDVAVMYLGRFIETGTAAEVFSRPVHPYSAALLSAVPRTSAHRDDESANKLAGDPPDPRDRPPGCAFNPRCSLYQLNGEPEICHTRDPELLAVLSHPGDHRAACHLSAPPTESAARADASQKD